MITTDPRAIYRANHSELRGITRHHFMKDRTAALKYECKERSFWFGDTWSRPASLAAQAALRTLMMRHKDQDPIAINAAFPESSRTVENQRIFHAVILSALRLMPRPALPA